MACLTKRQRQAKHQRASGGQIFNNGLVKDLLEVTLDPDYQPTDSDDHATDSETYSTNFGMAFSFLDDSEVKEESIGGDESGEESADDIVCTGMKRRRNGDFGDALVQFKAEETGDYIEKCA
ncbi:hypothetical protein SCLCIDRAFT_23390 [Scleroderma citrinum Foug A]|uniref:Uncharacterized protein n=1 Tax=Scleroderma citrinum Foug A TaxID=1036808 RepID=A0A0C3AIH7_9AGAM|nr:hypothetical protein SCLCIDRAFT_23390 [Scleroderma citrinum Foug A]